MTGAYYYNQTKYFYRSKMISRTLLTQPVSRPFNPSLIRFDLPALILKMKHERIWVNGDLNAMILLNGSGKKILLTILHEGTEISSFQSNDSVSFQILEGTLKLQFRKESYALKQGDLLTINEKIKYSYSSTEETAFLLTLISPG
jgi:quercetin dioxygenase-like cupin family protein